MLNSIHCRSVISQKSRAGFCSARFSRRLPVVGMGAGCTDTLKQAEWNGDSSENDFVDYSSIGELGAIFDEMCRTRNLIRLLEDRFTVTESPQSGVLAQQSRKELPAEGEI